MAKLDTNFFTQFNKTRNNEHSVVEATYTSFIISGKKYFQIDTYGSSTRKQSGKTSQTLPLHFVLAKLLVQLLIKEFNRKL